MFNLPSRLLKNLLPNREHDFFVDECREATCVS